MQLRGYTQVHLPPFDSNAHQRFSRSIEECALTNNRLLIIRSFRNNPACVVMCVCTRAGHGSAGLNLTCAQHVILLEPSLDVGMEAQAAGRVHRLGQTSEVTVHRLHTTGTIEDRIRTLQQRRRNLYEVNTDGLGELITDSDTYEMLEVFGLLGEAQSYSS